MTTTTAAATATSTNTTKTTITRRKSYKYRIYPTPAQIKKFEFTLNSCRELYNAALQERKDAYRQWKRLHQYVTPEVAKPSITCYSQCKELTKVKEVRPELYEVNAQVLQDVLRRVDKTFQAFFSRCREGKKPGYPRYKPYQRYNSFTYPQPVKGWSLHNEKLTLSKIPGTIKVKLHRKVIGKVKTCTIIREENGSKWYVVFSVEQEFEQPVLIAGSADITDNAATDANDNEANCVVGIDVGLEHYASFSDGEHVANPRYYRKSEKNLAKVQRRYSKLKHLPHTDKKKQKARLALVRAHKKVANQRKDFCHKLSRTLVNRFTFIAVEKLNVKGMAAGMYAKSVNDAAWSTFMTMLEYKAAEAGTQVVRVNARKTSQTCPQCGNERKKDISERSHICECGCEMQRDHAAAIVILGRGLATLCSNTLDAA